ncbi:hypothetical protein HY970_00905 [Candidatus Kaiserbacteria bacterium]|nr:hypothetical protein [Candidatus Kaiserbacteria bacterium]
MNGHKWPLRHDFPEELTAVLRDGEHRGRHQFWAHYEVARERFKLVVTTRWHRDNPAAGETWILTPTGSPNGHIVFCSLKGRAEATSQPCAQPEPVRYGESCPNVEKGTLLDLDYEPPERDPEHEEFLYELWTGRNEE